MLRTIWIIANLLISVVFCSIPIIFIGWIDNNKIFTSKIAKFWSRWMIWSTNLQYEIIGSNNININEQYVFMSNHESALDILFGVVSVPNRLVFLAKKELFFIPIFGWAMIAAGMIKIDRQNADKARKSVDAAIDKLVSSNFSTLIYPEGTRSIDNKIKEFKKGGFVLAIRTKIPIVPITINGTGNSLPKGSIKIKKNKITIYIGKPIKTNKLHLEDRGYLAKACKDVIESNKLKFQKI